MDDIFIFDKSFQQRLQEYNDVLSGFEVLPASSLKKEWGFYTELTVDPNGWQAIWKISRATCESFKIPFPTIVLVYVLRVDFPSLHAAVKILAVQDDIHIPDKNYVPLIQLWPTKTQDKSVALNLSSTANVIDMLRFFYLHLFMPWDLEDDSVDWKTKHLESRLRLFYDMRNGLIPKTISERIESLFTEARHLQIKKELLEVELEEVEIEDVNDEKVGELTDIHLKLFEIKNEVEILENPLMRKSFIKRHNQSCGKISNGEPKIWLIQEEGLAIQYISFLEQIKFVYPNSIVTVQPNLTSTLENGGAKDSFILSEGIYNYNVGVLESGVALKGMSHRDNTVLVSLNEDIMLDFQMNEILIENITIDARVSQFAAIIRRGKVTFSNCKIFGDGISTTHQGIIVLSGSELEMINCEIYGFFTSIVGNSGSKIHIESTMIHNSSYGLKIYDNSLLKLLKCSIRDCLYYGVCLETKNNYSIEETEVGNLEILNIIPSITTDFSTVTNNAKGDVIISHPVRITAVEDLFTSEDPTISEGDLLTEDGMDGDSGGIDRDIRNISPATI